MQYTAAMPVDVAAEVIANTPLSADYNVLALAAPAIAAAAAPGQFVMVKAGDRPRSAAAPAVFGVRGPARRRRRADRHLAPQQAHRRLDRAALRRATQASASPASVRSAGRSRSSIRRPRRGWSPAASGSRRSRRWPKRSRARGVHDDAVLRRAARRRSSSISISSATLGVELVLTTEDGSRGERGRIVAPLERRSRRTPAADAGDDLRVRPGRHARRHGEDRRAIRPPVPGVGRAHHGLRLGGCYSCVVPMRERATAASITCDRASPGRCWPPIRSSGSEHDSPWISPSASAR